MNTNNSNYTIKKLVFICICMFGIQFITALQMSNMSSIFKFVGASNDMLSYFWLAAPISGLFIQPIVGQLSDETYSRFGRRRPYIFFWMLVAVIASFSIISSTSLAVIALMLWALDCSLNGMNETFRALLSDIVVPKRKIQAFSMQTILAGTGASVAAATPWLLDKLIKYNNQNAPLSLPLPIRYAFIIGAIVLFLTIMITLISSKETNLALPNKTKKRKLKLKNFFFKLYKHLRNLPEIIKELMVVQIFTWIGLFSMWLFFSLTISQNIFHLGYNPLLYTTLSAHILTEGTLWTGVLFAIYQFSSVIFATTVFKYSKPSNAPFIHGLALFIGSISLITIALSHKLYIDAIVMLGIGAMWGSLMTLPYAILSVKLPKSSIGIYLGLFNATITIPQIFAGLILGPAMGWLYHNHASYVLLTAGISIALAGILMLYKSKTISKARQVEI